MSGRPLIGYLLSALCRALVPIAEQLPDATKRLELDAIGDVLAIPVRGCAPGRSQAASRGQAK